jgi:hypothetical protein
LPHGKKSISFRLTAIHASRRYQFFFASRQESISFHLMAIHASRRYRFLLCRTAKIDFIRLTVIHASRRYRFFLCLTAKIDFFPPDGNSCPTAIIDFSLPHGKNRFHPPGSDSRLTAMLSRFCPERQPICMLTGVNQNVIFGQRAGLPLSWLKTC